MARYSKAEWKPITAPKGRQPLTTYNRINCHVTASNATSQYSYFNQTGIPDSHFHVRKDGSVEQYVDTSMRAFADLDGNDATVSIETQGLGDEAWTSAQFEGLAQLIAWLMRTHGFERKLATSSKTDPSSRGLSWHRLGIDGNFPALPNIKAGRLQRGGGMHYSTSFGKGCPGDKRVDQMPALMNRVEAILDGTPTTEGFLMSLTNEEQDAVLWNVREIKKDSDALVALLVPTLKDGNGAAPLPDILERDLDVDRRALAAIEALTAKVDALTAKVDALTPGA